MVRRQGPHVITATKPVSRGIAALGAPSYKNGSVAKTISLRLDFLKRPATPPPSGLSDSMEEPQHERAPWGSDMQEELAVHKATRYYSELRTAKPGHTPGYEPQLHRNSKERPAGKQSYSQPETRKTERECKCKHTGNQPPKAPKAPPHLVDVEGPQPHPGLLGLLLGPAHDSLDRRVRVFRVGRYPRYGRLAHVDPGQPAAAAPITTVDVIISTLLLPRLRCRRLAGTIATLCRFGGGGGVAVAVVQVAIARGYCRRPSLPGAGILSSVRWRRRRRRQR